MSKINRYEVVGRIEEAITIIKGFEEFISDCSWEHSTGMFADVFSGGATEQRDELVALLEEGCERANEFLDTIAPVLDALREHQSKESETK